MSDNKRYYWLKLNENFFEDDTIQWLEEQENGKDYVIFYLKLCLKSLNDDGRLIRYVGEKLIPYDIKALSKLTNTSADTVAVAMKSFLEIGLIEQLDTGEIYMKQINEMIGSETDSARRMRRKRLLDDKRQELLGSPSHCDKDVQESDTEIEIDKEIERELENNNSPAKAEPPIPYKEIIEYLNEKSDRSFKHTTKKTQTAIKARFNEGFNLEDFYRVIDNKVHSWLNDKEMDQYLRPETLFGTKFEGYLNERPYKKKENKKVATHEELMKQIYGQEAGDGGDRTRA